MFRTLIVAASLLASGAASAGNVSSRCQGIPTPEGYDDQLQEDFLANYFAVAVSLSPLHGPIAVQAGHGSFGIDALVIPPLSCARQFVMGHTKTEKTNFFPVAPRFRVTYAFPEVLHTHLYAGLAYVPPVPIGTMRNVIAGGEIGAGWKLAPVVDLGVRFHYETLKTVGEIATPFVEGDPVVLDYYNASTLGGDALFGIDAHPAFQPYVSAGVLDASTYFWVGDDSVVVNNLHPYFGPAFSAGAAGHVDRFEYAVEGYAAPGGHSTPRGPLRSDPSADRLTFGNTGHVYTARLHLGVRI